MELRNSDFNQLFTEYYKRYHKSVIRFVRGFIYNRDISEEIAQDVFLKAYENADWEEVKLYPSKLRNFVFTIARNKAFDYLKRGKIESAKLREIKIEEVELTKEFFYDLENSYIHGEVISTLNETINSFPECQRKIFIDIVINKKKIKAISKEYKQSIYKIKKIRKEINRKIKDNVLPIIETSED